MHTYINTCIYASVTYVEFNTYIPYICIHTYVQHAFMLWKHLAQAARAMTAVTRGRPSCGTGRARSPTTKWNLWLPMELCGTSISYWPRRLPCCYRDQPWWYNIFCSRIYRIICVVIDDYIQSSKVLLSQANYNWIKTESFFIKYLLPTEVLFAIHHVEATLEDRFYMRSKNTFILIQYVLLRKI